MMNAFFSIWKRKERNNKRMIMERERPHLWPTADRQPLPPIETTCRITSSAADSSEADPPSHYQEHQ